MYIVYIGSDKIRIVDAMLSFGKIVVHSLYSEMMPNDYLDNPNDKSFMDIARIIADGLTQIDGRGKKVRVILENGTIPFTERVIPLLSPEKTIKLIRNDIFSDEKLLLSNVVDYVEVERYIQKDEIQPKDKKQQGMFAMLSNPKKDKKKSAVTEEKKEEKKKYKTTKMSRVYFTYISKDIINHLENFFKDLGYKLLSIDIYQNAIRKLVNKQMIENKRNASVEDGTALPGTMVLVEFKDDAITLFLFKNGKLGYTFRKTIISSLSNQFQSERLYFIAELTQTIKEALQFFRSKNPEIEYDGVYITGVLDEFDKWGPEVSSKIAYDLHVLKTPEFYINLEENEFNEFSGALAGFIRS